MEYLQKKIPTVKIPSPYGSYGEGFIEIRLLVLETRYNCLKVSQLCLLARDGRSVPKLMEFHK